MRVHRGALRRIAAAGVVLAGLLGQGAVQAEPGPDRRLSEARRFTVSRTPAGNYRLHERVEVAYTLLTPGATREGTYPIYEPFYAPLEGLRAELGGRRLPSDAFRERRLESRDVFLSGGRVHVLTLPTTPDVGDRLTYEFERTYDDLAYTPLVYVPADEHLDGFVVEVTHPAEVEVAFSFFFPRDEVPYRIDRSREGRTVLAFEGLDPLAHLPLFAFNGYHAVVQVVMTEEGRALNPVTPDDFGAWYGRKARLALNATPPGALDGLAASLEQDSPEATVAALHDYVRSTIRYIADERGENAFVPRAPDVVLERRYGDCKDRAFLVAALAEALGLRVDVVLVSTEPEPSFPGATHVGLFNHVINAFETDDGRTVYFDPTHRFMPYGDLPESDVEAPALRFGEAHTTLLHVPGPEEDVAMDVVVTASLDAPEGGRAHLTLRGDPLATLRYVQEQGGATDLQNVLAALTGRAFYKIGFTDFRLLEDGPDTAVLEARADLSAFVIASPTRRYLPQTPFPVVPAEALEREDDAFALHLPERPDVRLVLDLDTPGWHVEAAPVAFGAPGSPLHFTSVADGDEGRTRVEYRLVQRQKQLEGAARTAYLDAARAYLGARREVYIFNPVPVADSAGE